MHVLERRAGVRRHAEVLGDGEVREDAAALGHEAHAAARQRVGARPVTSLAEHVHRPPVGVELAARDLERGGLARAVRPEQREDLPAGSVEVDAVQHVDDAVARAHVAQRERVAVAGAVPLLRAASSSVVGSTTARSGAAPAASAAASPAPPPLAADGPSPRGTRRGRRGSPGSRGVPVRDDPAEVEHVDVIARAHDEAHVVLDEEHREAVGGERRAGARRASSSRSRSGRRTARRAAARAAWPRARARPRRAARCRSGSVSTFSSATAREPDAVDELVGELAGRRTCSRDQPAAHLGGDQHVVAGREGAERLESLERAADAHAAPGRAASRA